MDARFRGRGRANGHFGSGAHSTPVQVVSYAARVAVQARRLQLTSSDGGARIDQFALPDDALPVPPEDFRSGPVPVKAPRHGKILESLQEQPRPDDDNVAWVCDRIEDLA